MANRFQIKRTSVAGRTANVTNAGNSQYIAAGELALNMADSILYTSNGSSLITVGSNLVNQNISGNLTVKGIIANGSIGVSGQVLASNGSATYWADASGAGVNTDAQYTWTNTHTFQAPITFGNSSVNSVINSTSYKIDNSFSANGSAVVAANITANSVKFTNSGYTATEGVLVWNPDEGTLDLGLAGNNSINQIGQELVYRVKNQTGSTIQDGTLVMANGTLGASGRILVTPAIANGSSPSQYIMGIATEDIPNGGDGYVTHFGKVRGLNTSMWAEGSILYADPANTGGMTATKPTAPNSKTITAIVISSHASEGTLFVRPTYGSSIADDEKVELTSIANNDMLVYKAANGRFENSRDLYINSITTSTANITGAVTIGGVTTHNANIVLGSSGLSANGGFGTAGQVLHSNGTATYWSTDDQGVTSVASGNGITGGTITSTGTLSVVAGTGVVVNATGVHINATYIGTLSANNTTYVNGKTEGNLNVNNALTSNNSSYLGGVIASGYQTTAGLSANVATLTSNNSTYSYGKVEGALNVNSASYANASVTNTFTVGTASYFVANGNLGVGTNAPSYTLQVNGSFAATTKSFVIDHPTRSDMKLRYGSLEGPENGVYVRGRVQGQYIYLPDYWSVLVDSNTVTVSLTPISNTEMPTVLSWNSEKIVLSGDRIDCFYHVFGERKDVEKLIVEF